MLATLPSSAVAQLKSNEKLSTISKLKIFNVILLVIIINFIGSNVFAEVYNNQESELNIYKIKLDQLEKYKVLKKDTPLDLVLLNDISTTKNQINNNISFLVPNKENLELKASGTITKLSSGKRLSMSSSIRLSTNKLILDNGQEVYFSATSPSINAINPPHANPNSFRLLRTVANLSLASSPLTFGAGLGISFLASGILSAYQNGISDFVWGGLSGSGLSIVEDIFRKQPDIYLPNNSVIPFTLTEDLKISKGVEKEKNEYLNISKEEALEKINKLLEWGDLSGALELSVKSGQKEIYEQLLKKISS